MRFQLIQSCFIGFQLALRFETEDEKRSDSEDQNSERDTQADADLCG